MMRIWSHHQAQSATGGKILGAWQATGVAIDTRRLEKGNLFIAIIGENLDGHDFLQEARDKGVAAAMVCRKWYAKNRDDAKALNLPLLVVADTLTGLNDLARYSRAHSSARFIGITGSVGKTGTKQNLNAIFSQQVQTYTAEGNFNNHYGLPLTLANMPETCHYGIFELGMNHVGEIAHLTRILRPHIAIITTIQAVHLAHFRDIMAIAEAKAEIFQGLEQGGVALINRDNPLFHYLRSLAMENQVANIKSFGAHPESDARLDAFTLAAEGNHVKANIDGSALSFTMGVAGKHWIMSSLACLMTGKICGLDLKKAHQSLAQIRPPKGRGSISKLVSENAPQNPITLIDESYNASPASVRAALSVLGSLSPPASGRRIAILGDMLELGPTAPRFHANLAAKMAQESIDLVYTAGPLMESLWQALPPQKRGKHAKNAATLIPSILAALRPGDIVTVKGSLGSKMSPVVEAIQTMPNFNLTPHI